MASMIRPSTDTRTRWRVALLGAHDASRAALNAAVTHAGGQVVIEAPPRVDSLTLLAHAAPDVVILQPGRGPGRPPDLLAFTSAGRPVVLFTRDTSRAMLKIAARSGVAAFLVEPLQPAQLAPTLDLVVARFGDSEILRRKLADRKAIERAKGRLMALAQLTEEEAFRWLRTRAMDTRSRLGEVARAVLEDGAGLPEPAGAVTRLETSPAPYPNRPRMTLQQRRSP